MNHKSMDIEVMVEESNHLHGLIVNGSYREKHRDGGICPGDEKQLLGFAGLDELPILGRESSCEGEFFLGREASGNSVKLGRESNFDVGLAQIMVSADVHGFLLEQVAIPGDQPHSAVNASDIANFEDDEFMRSVVKFEQNSELLQSDSEQRNSFIDPEYANAAKAASYLDQDFLPNEAMRASKRGAHVKDRPDMQKTARDGAVHWANQLKLVKAKWSARAANNSAFYNDFQSQIDLSFGRIRSKQECLLRILQLAAADGVIKPGPFGGGGFFGWTRFDVAPDRATEFRRTIEALFPPSFKEDTLKETFRRSGLVPERWQWHLGWTGRASWVFHARTRP